MGKLSIVKLSVLDTLIFRISGIIGEITVGFFWRKYGNRVLMET